MEPFTTPEAGLIGLFTSAFLAATLLPGGSEVVFAGFIKWQPDFALVALMVATLGNTLGGMSSMVLGRLLPEAPLGKRIPQAQRWLDRWGPFALALSWVPLIGDVLCVLAGWQRMSWWQCALWMAVGKGARYAAILAALG
jgi:membrane protein YqaA with SNARE-associated domain